MEIASLNFMMV